MQWAGRRRGDAHRIDGLQPRLRGVGEDYGGGGWSQRWFQVGVFNGQKVVKWQCTPSQLALEVSMRTKGCPLVTCVKMRRKC
eukprot:scaffold14898_cov131-Isochrysis_galbana.AAC.1